MHTMIRIPLVLAAGLLFVGASSGCGKPRASVPPPPPPEVAIVTIAPERVALTTELPGRTSAFLVAEVRPQAGGIVMKRLFTEGADVKAGEVLYEIDPIGYQAAYANAKAACAKAKAAHAGAKAALSRAEANAVPLRLKAERFRELAAIDAVSKQDSDDASAAARQIEAEIRNAEAAVTGTEAEIEGAAAALETARINLSHTRVTAPISGRIGKSAVTTGALVTANQPAPLSTVPQLGTIYVDVTQSSANLLRLAPGASKQDASRRTATRRS